MRGISPDPESSSCVRDTCTGISNPCRVIIQQQSVNYSFGGSCATDTSAWSISKKPGGHPIFQCPFEDKACCPCVIYLFLAAGILGLAVCASASTKTPGAQAQETDAEARNGPENPLQSENPLLLVDREVINPQITHFGDKHSWFLRNPVGTLQADRFWQPFFSEVLGPPPLLPSFLSTW